ENGLDFTTIGTVAGNGNSGSTISYSFTDISPVSGKNYYRLVQVDNDGTETTTRVILIDFNSAGVTVAPNPFQGNATLSFTGKNEVLVKVMDISGRVLEMYIRNESENQIQVGSSLASGSYLIQVISENAAEVFKIIKE